MFPWCQLSEIFDRVPVPLRGNPFHIQPFLALSCFLPPPTRCSSDVGGWERNLSYLLRLSRTPPSVSNAGNINQPLSSFHSWLSSFRQQPFIRAIIQSEVFDMRQKRNERRLVAFASSPRHKGWFLLTHTGPSPPLRHNTSHNGNLGGRIKF